MAHTGSVEGGYEPGEITVTPEMIQAGVECLERSGYLIGDGEPMSGVNLLVLELLTDTLARHSPAIALRQT